MNNLPFDVLYIIASACLAVGIWVQMSILRKNEGKMPESSLFHILSLFDFVWAFVSGLVLYFVDFDDLAICVPVVHIIYVMLGFFNVSSTLKAQDTPPTSAEDIVFDERYMNFCQSFAMMFFGLCGFVLFRTYVAI